MASRDPPGRSFAFDTGVCQVANRIDTHLSEVNQCTKGPIGGGHRPPSRDLFLPNNYHIECVEPCKIEKKKKIWVMKPVLEKQQMAITNGLHNVPMNLEARVATVMKNQGNQYQNPADMQK